MVTTMTNKKASIIVTSYNKPEYLKRAIESCLIQDYDNLEIIIADDNSPNPDVWNVINSYSDQRIISFNSLIRDEDRLKTARYATQINLAVREYSTGEYLFYLADDDYFYPKMITKMMEYALKFNYDVCFCAQHIVDISGNIDGGGIEGRGVRFFPTILTRGADKLDHNQVMTSRKAFYDVGGWNDEWTKSNWRKVLNGN